MIKTLKLKAFIVLLISLTVSLCDNESKTSNQQFRTVYQNCLIEVTRDEVWDQFIEFNIELKNDVAGGTVCSFSAPVDFVFEDNTQNKLSFGSVTQLTPYTSTRLQGTGAKGIYKQYLDTPPQDTGLTIQLKENTQTEPLFAGNCFLEYSRCIVGDLIIQGEAGYPSSINVDIKKGNGVIVNAQIPVESDNTYKIDASESNTYTIVASIPGKSFYGMKDIVIVADPQFVILPNRDFFVVTPGQTKEITVTSTTLALNPFLFKCLNTADDTINAAVGSGEWKVELKTDCAYAFTRDTKLNIKVETLANVNKATNPTCKFLGEEILIELSKSPGSSIDLTKTEAKIKENWQTQPPSAQMTHVQGSNTFTYENPSTTPDDYIIYFYYAPDFINELFTLPMAYSDFDDLKFDFTLPEADELIISNPNPPGCVPSAIEVLNKPYAITCVPDNSDMKCTGFADYGNIDLKISEKTKTVRRYKLDKEGPYVINHAANQVAITSSLLSTDLAPISKITLLKKREATAIEFLKVTDDEEFKFDYIDSDNKITFNLALNDHEWYYVKSLIYVINGLDQEFEFSKNNLIGTEEPNFSLKTDFNYFKAGVTSEIEISLQFDLPQTALDYKEKVYCSDSKMTCVQDDVKLDCKSSGQEIEAAVYEVKLELSVADYSEGKQFSVFTYAVEPESTACVINDDTKAITITLDYANTILSNQIDSKLLSDDGKTISGAIKTRTALQLVKEFTFTNQSPSTYKYYAFFNSKKQQINGSEEIKLHEKKTIDTVGGILSGSNAEQTFDITFNQPITAQELKKFTFTEISKPTNAIPAICSAKAGNSKALECKATFPSTPSGPYALSWENQCGATVTYDQDITLASIILESIDKPVIKIPLQSDTTIKLTYNKDPLAGTIHFSNKDADDAISDFEPSLKPNTAVPTQPSIEIKTTDQIAIGLYSIITVLQGSSEESRSDKTLLVYKEALALAKPKKKVKKDSLIASLSVQFTNSDLFQSRFEKISYQKAGQPVLVTTYEVDSIAKKVDLAFVPDFKVDVNYVFEFIDRADAASKKQFTVEAIEMPNEAKLADNSIYFKQQNIEVTFDKVIDAFTVQTADSKVKLTATPKPSAPLIFLLELDPSTPPEYGKKATLDFLYDNEAFITPKPTIIFLNEDTYPQTIRNPFIKLKKTETSFKVEFAEELYEEYKAKFTAKIKAGSTPCVINEVIPEQNSLKITCSAIQSVGSYVIEIQFMAEAPLEVTVEVLTCNANELLINSECKKCIDIPVYNNKFPYLENGLCVDKCSGTNVIWDYACYANCAGTGMVPALFLKEDRKECVKECERVYYESKCYTKCSLVPDKTLYPNVKMCVDECPPGKGLNKKDECIQCTVLQGSKYCEECPPGTYMNADNKCALIDETNPVEDCQDYCAKDKYESCYLDNYKPVCNCKNTYHGLTCSIEDKDKEKFISDHSTKLFESPPNRFEYNADVISDILNTKSLIKEDKTLSGKIAVTSANVIKRILNNEEIIPVEQYIDLSLKILTEKLAIVKKQSKIYANEDSKTYITDIEAIIKKNNEFIKAKALKIAEGAKCLPDENELIFCLSYQSTSQSLEKYKKKAQSKQLTIITLPESITYSQVLQVEVSSKIKALTSGIGDISNQVYFSVLDVTGEPVTLQASSYKIQALFIPEVDKSNYIYYYDRGIDIYNPSDPAFTNVCYTNKVLTYDMSPSYRTSLFAKKTIEASSKDCIYKGLDLFSSYILFDCTIDEAVQPIENFFKLKEAELLTLMSGSTNIPTACLSSVSNIATNAAFWIYLLITLPFAIAGGVLILLNYLRGRGKIVDMENEPEVIELQIKDDSIPLNDVNHSNSLHEEQGNDEKSQQRHKPKPKSKRKSKIQEEDIDIPNEDKVDPDKEKNVHDFYALLYANMLQYHPLPVICQESIVFNPLPFKMLLFVFNLCTQFGFLAVFYTETLIDQRRTKREKDYFDYTLKYEFLKLIFALLASIVCTVAVKLASLITLAQKKKLDSKLKSLKKEEAKKEKL